VNEHATACVDPQEPAIHRDLEPIAEVKLDDE